MANVTLYVPDQLKRRMDSHKEIRWSNAIRSIIEQKLEDLEEANRIASKSKLTMKDAEMLAAKVNEAAGKHAEALLNEINSRR